MTNSLSLVSSFIILQACRRSLEQSFVGESYTSILCCRVRINEFYLYYTHDGDGTHPDPYITLYMQDGDGRAIKVMKWLR
jgi:hypothetical protein